MIYQREREIQERQTFHRKQQLKDALASGKNLPTELRRDAVNLGKDLQFDEAQVGEFFQHQRKPVFFAYAPSIYSLDGLSI